MNTDHEILNFATDTGEALLKFGGEIYRVKDTIEMILESYGIHEKDVYILSNGVFVSINGHGAQICSAIRDVPLCSTNLSGIAAINQLSRDICINSYSLSEARKKLDEAIHVPMVSDSFLVIACTLGCGAFCYLFGGTLLDSLCSALCGLVLRLYMNAASRHNISRFLSQILGSGIVTAISLLLLSLALPVHQDRIVIGAIMPLVPGVVFTTSIRDFFNGDYLSGTIHMIDALLTALSIAIGVGAVITVYRLITGGALLP